MAQDIPVMILVHTPATLEASMLGGFAPDA